MFDLLLAPPEAVFHQRHDPYDRRLGEVVGRGQPAYTSSKVVLLGCPQDEGVRRNKGRVGAAQAPDAIRTCLYKLTAADFPPHFLIDMGNIPPQPTLEETHAVQQAVVKNMVEDGKIIIMLGGGNDVSYPDCSGVVQALGEVLAFNIDAHYDVRADTPPNSGTPYRQLLTEGYLKPHHFFELGSQPFANSPTYTRYLQELGVGLYPYNEWMAQGFTSVIAKLLENTAAPGIFWGIDLDVVRASDAPGVSAPNALGLSGEQVCQLAALAGQEPRTRLIEFSEVNPLYDLDQRTCRLTAAAIFFFLTAVANRLANP